MLEIKKRLMDHIPPEKILMNQPLAPYTTFNIGGPADLILLPSETSEIKQAVTLCQNEQIPYYILGKGSNVLIDDKGLKGLVIYLGENFKEIEIADNRLKAKSGTSLKQASIAAASEGLGGLEFARGIPGSLGGAVYMNAGAFDYHIEDVIETVTVLSENGERLTFTGDKIAFGYRWSSFQEEQAVILEVELILYKEDCQTVENRMQQMMARREAKQPLEFPSAGSVFKRPEGHYAGKLIQDSGLKGYRIGGAQVSEKHCGFIVNKAGAASGEVKQLIAHIQETVYRKFGVWLERELKYLG